MSLMTMQVTECKRKASLKKALNRLGRALNQISSLEIYVSAQNTNFIAKFFKKLYSYIQFWKQEGILQGASLVRAWPELWLLPLRWGVFPLLAVMAYGLFLTQKEYIHNFVWIAKVI